MYFLLHSLADLHEGRAKRTLEELLAHQQGGGEYDQHEHNDLRAVQVHVYSECCNSQHMYIAICGV